MTYATISQRSIALRGNAGRCKSRYVFAQGNSMYHYVLYMGKTDDYVITNDARTCVLVIKEGERSAMWLPLSMTPLKGDAS